MPYGIDCWLCSVLWPVIRALPLLSGGARFNRDSWNG
jgi:hypothetical protein